MNILTPKRCTKCGEKKERSEFPRNRQAKDGLYTKCKECCNKERHEFYNANPEHYREYARERETRLRLESAEHRKRNQEKSNRWRLENPLRYAALMAKGLAKRRALLKNVEGEYTTDEWEERRDEYGFCVYCGKKTRKLTTDHVVPLKSKGANSIDNIAPACKSCNSSKNDTPLLVWLWRKFTHG